MSRADVSGVDVSGADLNRADLNRTDLKQADLNRAKVGRPNLLWQLPGPGTAADRHRQRLTAAAVAGTGSFLLAAYAIVTYSASAGSIEAPAGADQQTVEALSPLAPYVAEPGLRGGSALAAVLLAVPFVLFGVQALRTGTAARERRLATLSLAGATGSQLRSLAVAEGTRAAVFGGLLAGPGYLLLWLLTGRALPAGWRMLPDPGWPTMLAWMVLIVVLAAAGAIAAAATARPAAVTPLGISRRTGRRLRPVNALLPLASLLLLIAGFALMQTSNRISDLEFTCWVGVFVLLGISSGPWLVVLIGSVASGGQLLTSIAGRRLLADPRTPGRVVAVFLAVGGAFGVIFIQVGDLVSDGLDPSNRWFYLGGFAAAAIGAAFALIVAAASLVVGATEQVLDGRRSTAALVALAASPSYVSRIVRRQLALAVVPSAALGALLGWLVMGQMMSWQVHPRIALGALLGAVVVSSAAAVIGAVVATRLMRERILDASAPDNLRMP